MVLHTTILHEYISVLYSSQTWLSKRFRQRLSDSKLQYCTLFAVLSYDGTYAYIHPYTHRYMSIYWRSYTHTYIRTHTHTHTPILTSPIHFNTITKHYSIIWDTLYSKNSTTLFGRHLDIFQKNKFDNKLWIIQQVFARKFVNIGSFVRTDMLVTMWK